MELLRSDKPIAASRGYFLFVFNALMEFMREVVKHSIRVKVIPNAKRECVEVARDGRFIVSVGVPRAKGLANARMRELLAEHLHVPLAKIVLRGGHTSPTKTVLVVS